MEIFQNKKQDQIDLDGENNNLFSDPLSNVIKELKIKYKIVETDEVKKVSLKEHVKCRFPDFDEESESEKSDSSEESDEDQNDEETEIKWHYDKNTFKSNLIYI